MANLRQTGDMHLVRMGESANQMSVDNAIRPRNTRDRSIPQLAKTSFDQNPSQVDLTAQLYLIKL